MRHSSRRPGRAEGQRWLELSYECVRITLLCTWLDVFTLPSPADYQDMPRASPHLSASERCWCQQCMEKRMEEGEAPCGCVLCLTVAHVSSKALENRRYIRLDQLSTGGDWRAPT